MSVRAAAALLVLLAPPALRAAGDEPPAPAQARAAARRELVVFKGTLLFNEFVYRALLDLPPDAKATPELARRVAGRLARFLRDAGYELATVRARVAEDQIEVDVDEGQLDKIILLNAGAITTVRFKLQLRLPLDVFNRPLLEQQLPLLAQRFRLRAFAYELRPSQQEPDTPGPQLDAVEELKAMPFMRSGRAWELRILADQDPWGTGLAPELVADSRVGLEGGARYRWRDLLQDGDRWEVRARAGVARRSTIVTDEVRLVNSHLVGEARWSGRVLAGAEPQWLRATAGLRAEALSAQRVDLGLESFSLGAVEAVAGVDTQLLPSLFADLTLGVQRRWLYGVEAAVPPWAPEVAATARAANRGFARLRAELTFNPGELRRDLRDRAELDLTAWTPASQGQGALLRVDAWLRKLWTVGWHDVSALGHTTAALGDVSWVDEEALGSHVRLGLGDSRTTSAATSVRLELRWSLLRDVVKVGLFDDLAVFRAFDRTTRAARPELAGSVGAGLHFLLADDFQLDLWAGGGWSTDGLRRTGFALALREAF